MRTTREALESVLHATRKMAAQNKERSTDPNGDDESRSIAAGGWAAYTTIAQHIEAMIAEGFSDDPDNIIDASARFGGSTPIQ